VLSAKQFAEDRVAKQQTHDAASRESYARRAMSEVLHVPAADVHGRSPMLELCNALVRVYKEAYGRGPTKARASLVGSDTVVVVLEHSLTPMERNLLALGEDRRLRELRVLMHDAMEDEFREVVERTLRRRTVACVGGIDVRRDVAVETFTLEPAPEDGSAAAFVAAIADAGQPAS
jgi:uncharacterized protein YbcI